MLSSAKMYVRSQQLFKQSENAFAAEMTLAPFSSAAFGFRMLSTSAIHAARCAINLGLALYCIGNTAHAAYNENDSDAALGLGASAICNHFAAAAVDFANIFFTLGAVLARTIATMIDRCEETVIDSICRKATAYVGAYVGDALSLTYEAQGYNKASTLDYSVPVLPFQ